MTKKLTKVKKIRKALGTAKTIEAAKQAALDAGATVIDMYAVAAAKGIDIGPIEDEANRTGDFSKLYALGERLVAEVRASAAKPPKGSA
jgi:hypothetical protein